MSERDSQLTPLEDEAHAWIRVLVSGKATAADADALKRWCGLSAAHAAAFSAASQYWQAFGPAGRDLLKDERAATVRQRAMHRRPAIGRRAVLGGALAASAAGFLIARPPLGLWPSFSELRADYRTGAGEQRQVAVGDGVAVQLNSRTSLSVTGDGEQAVIELIAGEAAFVAASDPGSKPFTVIAAGGRASAVNARFDLRLLPSGASVTCLTDQVEVSYRGQTATLGPRQRVTYGDDGLGKAISIDPAVVSAWQKGIIVFNMTPLGEAIEELNRHRNGRIVLLNAQIAHEPLNGQFKIDRPEEALMQIERVFGVQRRTLPGGFILLS